MIVEGVVSPNMFPTDTELLSVGLVAVLTKVTS